MLKPHQETCSLAKKMLRSSSSLCSSKILVITETSQVFDPFPAYSTLKSCWVFLQTTNLTFKIFPLSSAIQVEPESRSCLLGRDFGWKHSSLVALSISMLPFPFDIETGNLRVPPQCHLCQEGKPLWVGIIDLAFGGVSTLRFLWIETAESVDVPQK